MKTLLLLIVALFVFSGCSTRTQNYRLRTLNAQQAALIQKQHAQIRLLKAKLEMRNIARAKARARARAKTSSAVSSSANSGYIPKPPKKNIKLKKVEDNNYSSSYMYPGAKKKTSTPSKIMKSAVTTPNSASTVPPVSNTVSSGMSKAECISMIGADKFAKYTQMFGSESASLKRCKMLKAMKQ